MSRKPRLELGEARPATASEQLDAVLMQALPSEWAIRNRRIMNTSTHQVESWSFRHREWQRDIMDDTSQRVVVMKAAQMGVTEIAQNRALHAVDALGLPVLYLFPTERDVSDFSQARFDTMLRMSPRLKEMFTDVANVGLKRAGNTPIYFRGSNSPSQLKSIPVAYLIIDEFEEMVETSVTLARKRTIGHARWFEINLSTPRYPGAGIDKEFALTDQRKWKVPCHLCGAFQELTFERNLVIPDKSEAGSCWKCGECDERWSEQERLDLLDRGRWEADNPGSTRRGYHISQLYSPVATAERIGAEWHDAQISATRLQEFYNSFLGLAHEVKGIKVTEGMVLDCIGTVGSVSVSKPNVTTCLGVDIGMKNNWVVGLIEEGKPRILAMGETDWSGLPMLMSRFNVELAVVDAAPERHAAHAFREAFSGEVYLAFYPNTETMSGLEVRWNDEAETVDIHRTAVADRVVGRFSRREFLLPGDTPRDFVRHCTAVYRALEVTPQGFERAVWKHRGPDHFFHALVYLDVALERAFDFEEDDIEIGLSMSSPDPGWTKKAGEEGDDLLWTRWVT